MALPVVTIVGRPNVGKSSILNALARERISIVASRAGVTRDRISTIVAHEDYYFEIVDTGGVGIVDDDNLEAHVEDQIRFAIARADIIVFVGDAHDGLMPLDQTVAELLRPVDLPVIMLVNKVDTEGHVPEAADFSRLGYGDPVPFSAVHGSGRNELLSRIVELLGRRTGELPVSPVMKLAIVGKRNAGKSTLTNVLAGEERVIVSETPGTTRDAVDVRFQIDGRELVAIDTAGVRKKRQMQGIEFYGYARAKKAIERADVVMHMIDAMVPVSEVDVKIANTVLAEFKPVLLVINKWDLAKDIATSEAFNDYLAGVLPQLDYAPIAFMSAKDKKNVFSAIDACQSLFNQSLTRIGTGALNRTLETILEARGPSAKRGTKRVKIYYGTQVAVAPPTFVFSCNAPEAVTENYRRYMENRLRELTPLKEVPIRLLFRSHHREPAKK